MSTIKNNFPEKNNRCCNANNGMKYLYHFKRMLIIIKITVLKYIMLVITNQIQ